MGRLRRFLAAMRATAPSRIQPLVESRRDIIPNSGNGHSLDSLLIACGLFRFRAEQDLAYGLLISRM
jgi:hypothetical protein